MRHTFLGRAIEENRLSDVILFDAFPQEPASEDIAASNAARAAEVVRKQEIAEAMAGLEGMAGIDSALLETLFDETPLQASRPQNQSEHQEETHVLPVGVGNRLAHEVEGQVETEDQKDLGNPNKLAVLSFAGSRAELDPVYFLAFPSGEDRRSLSESPSVLSA